MSTSSRQSFQKAKSHGSSSTVLLLGTAGIMVLLHVFTNHLYGFHRDELQFLSDARHLDWGFVAYPPLTPWIERISLQIFGLSMTGLRLASVLAQSFAIVVTGLMTYELDGGRLAQVAAALAVALSPTSLFEGTEFQYTSFDYLWWVLLAYFVVHLLKDEDPRWWLAIGASISLGFLTKYTILILVAGLLCGFLATPARLRVPGNARSPSSLKLVVSGRAVYSAPACPSKPAVAGEPRLHLVPFPSFHSPA